MLAGTAVLSLPFQTQLFRLLSQCDQILIRLRGFGCQVAQDSGVCVNDMLYHARAKQCVSQLRLCAFAIYHFICVLIEASKSAMSRL